MEVPNFEKHYNTLQVGDRVVELDTKARGIIIEIHNKYKILHAVMRDDNGKLYDHNLSHYLQLKTVTSEKEIKIGTELWKLV